MKKLFYLMAVAVVFVATFSLTGCIKQVVSSPYTINDSTYTAVLKGIVYANLDNGNAGYERAPQGTEIFVTIDLDELNPNAENGTKIYKTNVQADGTYQITIPVNNTGVAFSIVAQEFEFDQIQFDESTVRMIYMANDINDEAFTGQILIRDIVYGTAVK